MKYRLIKIICICITLAILISGCNKNHSPLTPDIPGGPTIGRVDTAYNFSILAIDPDGDSVAARCAWEDGDTSYWSPLVMSGNNILLSHLWSDTGIYYVKGQVQDKSGASSNWSEPCSIRIIIDEPPLTPTMPAGPSNGKIGFSYDFASSTTDPDGDKISIRFDWGNEDTSDWSNFISSGDTITMSNTWITPETYSVKVQAMDVYDMTSDWSEGFPVMITDLGTLKWRYHTSDYREIRSSPAIGSDGTIYFGSLNDTLYALNPNGTLKWCYHTNQDIYSSPAIGSDGTIYGGGGSWFYAMNPDGTVKWRCGTWSNGAVASSPLIGSDGTIYFGLANGSLEALNPDGTLKWVFHTGYNWIESSPAIGPDSTIYFGGHDGYLYAIQGSGQLANTPWPKFRHDSKNTGRFSGP